MKITQTKINKFKVYLFEEEKSKNTNYPLYFDGVNEYVARFLCPLKHLQALINSASF